MGCTAPHRESSHEIGELVDIFHFIAARLERKQLIITISFLTIKSRKNHRYFLKEAELLENKCSFVDLKKSFMGDWNVCGIGEFSLLRERLLPEVVYSGIPTWKAAELRKARTFLTDDSWTAPWFPAFCPPFLNWDRTFVVFQCIGTFPES